MLHLLLFYSFNTDCLLGAFHPSNVFCHRQHQQGVLWERNEFCEERKDKQTKQIRLESQNITKYEKKSRCASRLLTEMKIELYRSSVLVIYWKITILSRSMRINDKAYFSSVLISFAPITSFCTYQYCFGFIAEFHRGIHAILFSVTALISMHSWLRVVCHHHQNIHMSPTLREWYVLSWYSCISIRSPFFCTHSIAFPSITEKSAWQNCHWSRSKRGSISNIIINLHKFHVTI